MSKIGRSAGLATTVGRQVLFMAWHIWFGICLTASSPLVAQVPQVTEQSSADRQVRFFEQQIRPLLVDNCVKCHGPEKQEGGLRLDSREYLLQGGDSGASIQAGQADKSLMISAVRHEDLEMPPGKKLADDQIEALAAWINQGAPWSQISSSGLEIRRQKILTDDDRNYWAFRPLAAVLPPDVSGCTDAARVENEIDAFIVAALDTQGLSLAPPADSQVLVRRLYFDLIGVPPTPAELDQFSSDENQHAYEHLVDRLLDDPRYGQHWARHWLDLVRYAESDGFKQDAYRPAAYLYRDYVVNALNQDLAYDRFVTEQLAGDEIDATNPEALAATGFLRHWIYEYNQRDVRSQWNNILNDLTDVTGEVFLGLGLACARCHDHKFDPILQKDYYRLQASFAAFLPRDTTIYGSATQLASYRDKLEHWEQSTADIRAEMDEIEREVRTKIAAKAIDKFPPDVRPLLRRAATERSPHETQLADLAFRQVSEELNKLDFSKSLKGAAKERWEELKQQLQEFDKQKPKKSMAIMAAGETGPAAPETFIPGSKDQVVSIQPAALEVLGAEPLLAVPPAEGTSTGRRTALAAWLNSPANPLPHRVIVNRVWQYHFGSGLVSNANDFGRLGQPPSHPELLDWLANWWLENGRSLKRLHKLIVMSATYRQSSQHAERVAYELIDNENRTLWHFPARRLGAEQVRDAMLVAADVIDWSIGGPAVDQTDYRRTIFTKVIRNKPDPLLSALDAPDGSGSVAKRNTTTTSVQSLVLANSPWPIKLADAMATSLRGKAGSTEDQIRLAYRRVYARLPSDEELGRAMQFMDNQMQLSAAEGDAYTKALSDLCHVLFNSSEFLYFD